MKLGVAGDYCPPPPGWQDCNRPGGGERRKGCKWAPPPQADAMANITIRAATSADVGLILEFIRGIAEYERLSHEVVATEAGLQTALFGPRPAAEVVLGYAGDAPAGFAVFFHNFSTFLGRAGLYLEDLFVKPEFRGQGLGEALFRHVAGEAVRRQCGRFDWVVLDWNEPAKGFYQKLGAVPMDDWRVFRLTGPALATFGEAEAGSGPD